MRFFLRFLLVQELVFARHTGIPGLWTLDSVCWALDPGRSKDHGHACSVETIGSEVDIFRNSILTFSVTL